MDIISYTRSVLAYCGLFDGPRHQKAIVAYLYFHIAEGKAADEAFCLAYEDYPDLLQQCSAVAFVGEQTILLTTADAWKDGRPTTRRPGMKVKQTTTTSTYATIFFKTTIEVIQDV